MRVALAQIAPKLSRTNLKTVTKIAEDLRGKCDLVVFPELALSGYMLQDKLFEDAFALDELSEVAMASVELDIAVGAAMRSEGGFLNSALYFSNGSFVSKHDKVHLPNYGMFEEARYFSSGVGFESFESRFGKVCMVVCEDLWHETTKTELAKLAPSLIIALVASPARGFSDDGLWIAGEWKKIACDTAKACGARLVLVNRIGFEDGLGFWGGSMVVDADGAVKYELPYFEEKIEILEI